MVELTMGKANCHTPKTHHVNCHRHECLWIKYYHFLVSLLCGQATWIQNIRNIFLWYILFLFGTAQGYGWWSDVQFQMSITKNALIDVNCCIAKLRTTNDLRMNGSMGRCRSKSSMDTRRSMGSIHNCCNDGRNSHNIRYIHHILHIIRSHDWMRRSSRHSLDRQQRSVQHQD